MGIQNNPKRKQLNLKNLLKSRNLSSRTKNFIIIQLTVIASQLISNTAMAIETRGNLGKCKTSK